MNYWQEDESIYREYKLNLSGLNTGVPCRSQEFEEVINTKKT